MKKLTNLVTKNLRWGLTFATWGSYVVFSFIIQEWVGAVIAAMSLLPVVVTSWYFGLIGSALAVISALMVNAFFLIIVFEYSFASAFLAPGVLWVDAILGLSALSIGFLSNQTQRLKREILYRKTLDEERQEYTDFLALLNNITRAALESDDLPAMLETLANRMGELFGTDNSYITLWDDEQQLTIPAAAFGPQSSSFLNTQFEPGEKTLTAKALQMRQALSVFDAATSPDVHPQKAPAVYRGSMLVLPLIAGERKLGAAILAHNSFHHFTEDEIARGEMVARHISLALDKGLLLEDAERNLQELSGMHAISKTFSATQEVTDIYGLLTERLATLIDAQICVVSLFNPESGELCAQLPGYGIADDLLVDFRFPLETLLESLDFTNFENVDLANNIDNIPTEFQSFVQKFQVNSVIVAAMHAESELLGFVFAANKPRGFTERDAHLMSIFAVQAAAVLRNARLFQQTQRNNKELAALFKLSNDLAAINEEKRIVQLILDSLSHELDYDYLGFYLVDPKTGDRVLQASAGWHDNPEIVCIPPGRGITERPILDGQLHYTPDVTKEPLYLVGIGNGSEVDVPIWIDGEVEGVLAAEKKEPYAFSQRDLDVLAAAANLAGLALTRGRLFSAERKQFEELAVLHAIALAITESVNENQLIERATQIIGVKLYSDNFGILLTEEGSKALRIHPSYSIDKKLLGEGISVPFGRGIIGRVAETGMPERIADVTLVPHYLGIDKKPAQK